MMVSQYCEIAKEKIAIFLQSVLISEKKMHCKIIAKFLQYGRTIILEKIILLFNFKGIYAWHFYGTRGILLLYVLKITDFWSTSTETVVT